MSFWQIFERINRITRSNTFDLFSDSRRFDDELRRAQELIDGERRREEEEKRARDNGTNGRPSDPVAEDGLTIQDACAIIGVSASATLAEISVAYRKRIAEVHPDRYTTRSLAEQAEAVARTQRLNQAYAFMKRYYAT